MKKGRGVGVEPLGTSTVMRPEATETGIVEVLHAFDGAVGSAARSTERYPLPTRAVPLTAASVATSFPMPSRQPVEVGAKETILRSAAVGGMAVAGSMFSRNAVSCAPAV